MREIILLLATTILGVGTAQAQSNIQVGPRLGMSATTTRFTSQDGSSLHPKFALGGEIGATAEVRWEHLGLQVSGLFTQKGFRLKEEYQPKGSVAGSSYQLDETIHLQYASLPINLTYSQHENGQGFQVFAGTYAAMLLSGSWKKDDIQIAPQLNGNMYGYVLLQDSEVRSSAKADRSSGYGSNYIYSKPWDAGAQAGAGYRYTHLLVQLSYSAGVVNLEPTSLQSQFGFASGSGARLYYNRAIQISTVYFLTK